MTSAVGFIGIGKMGGAILDRFINQGGSAVIYDPVVTSTARFSVNQHVELASSVKEVADKVSVIIASLPNASAAREVLLGEHGVHSGHSALVYVETSTLGPDEISDLHRALMSSKSKVQLLSAPVSGGPRGAIDGSLTSIISGPPEVYEIARPTITMYSGKLFYVGSDVTYAQICKVVNNAISLSTFVLVAEALVYGASLGVPPEKLLEVVNSSTGRCVATTDKFPRAVLSRTFALGGSISIALKDLKTFVNSGHQRQLDRSCIEFIQQKVGQISAEIGLSADYSRIVQYYERVADTKVSAK